MRSRDGPPEIIPFLDTISEIRGSVERGSVVRDAWSVENVSRGPKKTLDEYNS